MSDVCQGQEVGWGSPVWEMELIWVCHFAVRSVESDGMIRVSHFAGTYLESDGLTGRQELANYPVPFELAYFSFCYLHSLRLALSVSCRIPAFVSSSTANLALQPW